ncbi:MAG: phosphoribosylanthranilate isomerase [Bacteroidales bacterium]
MRTRIKICCISSIEEAKMAIEAGADAIGLVGKMPSGPGPITDDLIRKIASIVPPPVDTFLLTSETKSSSLINHYKRALTRTIQIVDKPDEDVYRRIRDELPWVKIVQVIHVTGIDSVEEAIKASAETDAILLDSGNPSAKIRELGGTGRVHDWSLSRQIRQHAKCPVILAGLRPENVSQAIAEVEPYAVDVCSGVRTDGKLDSGKLKEFIKNVYSSNR